MRTLIITTILVLGLTTSASADRCYISTSGSMGCSSWSTSSGK